MSEIKFGDLPPDGRSSNITDWPQIVAALRARPGEWAMVGRRNGVYVTRIKRGGMGFLPVGAFEAAARNSAREGGSRYSDIWVRYIGENGEYR